MRITIAALALLALTACEAQPEGEPVARARIDGQAQVDPTPDPTPTETLASQVESACRSIIFEDTPVTHCLAVPARHSIGMALGRDGKFYRS